jgi:hypothetical protein
MSEPLSFTELESTATSAATASQTTTEDTSKAAATATTSTTAAEDTKPQFTQTDVDAYQQLVALGITPQNAEQFKLAKTAMDNLPALMRQNPDALLDEIQKNDPELHELFLERVSDRWYQQKGKRQYEEMQRKNGNGSRVAESEPAVDPETEKMKREWVQFKAQQATESANREAERVSVAYNKALDALVEKLPENVPEDKREHIRLKAEKMMWQDMEARARIQKGVFTDVTKYFAEASKRVTAETKTAAQKEHDARKAIEERGTRTIVPAAENVAGAAKEQGGPNADPVWGDITKEEIERAYK